MGTKLRDWLIYNILNRSKLCLILAFSFTLISLPFVPKQNFDFGPTAWFASDDSEIQVLEKFERTFGNDESILVLLYLPEKSQFNDIFNSSVLSALEALTEEMWLIPEVGRVESMANYHWSYGQDDEIITEAFIDLDLIHDDSYLESLKENALNHNVLPNAFFSPDKQSALIYGHLVHHPSRDPDNRLIVEKTTQMIEAFKSKHPSMSGHIDFKILGQPYLSDRYQAVSFRDIFIITPILLGLMVLYLWLSYRSIHGVLIPLSVIATTVITTIGLNGYLFLTVNSLTFVLPSILMAISIADSVHILSTFYHRYNLHFDWEKASKEALEKNFWPIFLTSVSTAFGFFSLTVSTIKPVAYLGLMAGIGVLLAMVFSFLLVVPLLGFVGRHKRAEARDLKFQNRVLPVSMVKSYISWVENHCAKILSVFALLTVLGVIYGLKNEINSNPFRFFVDSDPISQSNQYVLNAYNGAGGPEIIIDSLVSEGVKDPQFLNKVDQLSDWLMRDYNVNYAISIIDVLKEVNQALYSGDPDEYRIHDDQSVIAQELFLYTMGLPQGMDITNRIDYDNRLLRMSVLWAYQDSKSSLDMVGKIQDKAQQLGLNLYVTGKGILFQQMNNHIVLTFFTSMGTALLLITCLMILVFSSFYVGFMSLIPNFTPILLGAGLLSILSIPIDIASAIIASVTLGIAVDDTIHFLSHYSKLYREQGRNPSLQTVRNQMVEIISTTGLALVLTTLILVSCFGLFLFADLRPNMIFGLMSAFIISLALICDLLVLPALIFFLTKRKGASQIKDRVVPM